jgi:hypothetical protein
MKIVAFTSFLTMLFALASMAGPEIQKLKLQPFREVSLRISANLYIEQGDNSSIVMEAEKEILDKIIVEVVDHKLIIRYSIEDMFLHGLNQGHVTLRVTTPNIEMLGVAGSGNIIAEKQLNTRVIELNITGSGDIKIAKLKCERVEAEITGSGNIIVSGEPAQEIKLLIAGSGNLMATQLKTEYAKIRVAGSGNCEVAVSDFLDAQIFGSGDIRYMGNPKLESTISGSGKIRKIN